MIYFPFDSEEIKNDEGEIVGYDREFLSDDYASYLKNYFGNGVPANSGTNLQVYATEVPSGNVVVFPGFISIEGRGAEEKELREIMMPAADPINDRIDNVVVRMDKTLRIIDLYAVQGIAGAVPTAPAYNRIGDIYEMVIGQIFRPKGVNLISQERITDTRLNADLCGIMTFKGQEVDATGIFNQYQASLDAFLELVQQAIDETLAGNLQTQINELETQITNVSNYASNIDALRAVNTNKLNILNFAHTTYIDPSDLKVSNLSPFSHMYTIPINWITDKMIAKISWNIVGNMLTDKNSYKIHKEAFSKISYVSTREGNVDIYVNEPTVYGLYIIVNIESTGE